MKIGVVGSRQFNNKDLLYTILKSFVDVSFGDILIVSGGAKGADTLAEKFANENNLNKLIIPAQWDRYGKRAGPIRNQLIVDNSEMIIAFPAEISRGTWDTITKAKKDRKKILIVYEDLGYDLWIGDTLIKHGNYRI
jgi:predicted Rossmann fold nucleotide-binding protein DprA/Smf involved in DNA uptake